MANELQATAQLSYNKGNARLAAQSNVSVDVAGTAYCNTTQSIPTTDASVVFGGAGTPGYFMLQNLDATNYVDIGFDGSTYPFRLAPGTATAGGGVMMGPNNGATIHAKANTAACLISIQAIAP